MRGLLAAIIGVSVLAGCQDKEDLIAFDGNYYRTSLSKGDARTDFTVSSRPASQSIVGAAQAAQYEAFTYCINEYGSSDIDWVIGPDLDPESYVIVDDILTLQGACPN